MNRNGEYKQREWGRPASKTAQGSFLFDRYMKER